MKKTIFIIIIALIWCFLPPDLARCEEDLSGLVELKRIDIDFTEKGQDEISMILMSNFINKPYEMQFNKVTTDNWVAKYARYKESLLKKAVEQGFDVKSLEKAITINGEMVAELPIGAYLAKLGQGDVWVIVYKWEFVYKDKIMSFGHVLVKAYKASDNSVIGSASCR